MEPRVVDDPLPHCVSRKKEEGQVWRTSTFTGGSSFGETHVRRWLIVAREALPFVHRGITFQ